MSVPSDAEPQAEVPASRVPVRILVVDDDKVDRINVRRSLRNAGLDIDVEECASSSEALDRIAQGGYDCIFLDYFLPDGNGLAFIHSARAAGVRAPVIVLTGQGDEQTAVEIMKAGASDYLPKGSATPERIAQCLRNAVRIAQAERQAMLAEQERARALTLERLARDEAESAQRRLAFLAEASALASASLDYETTLENVARLAVPALADWCFVDLLQADGSFERVAVAHADPAHDALARRFRRRYAGMPQAPHGISRVIATGRSEVMTHAPDWVLVSLARDAEHLAMMRELSPRSIMTVPLVARGRTLGAVTFVANTEGRYTQQDLEVAEALAYRAALAVDNARLFHDAKKAEERAREQLDLTSAITGSLAEGVCALDRDGRVVFANPAAEDILRLPRGGAAGRAFDELVHHHPGRACPLVAAVLEGAVLRVDDDAFACGDGARVPVSYVVGPITSGGVVTGCVLAFHDTTERRRAEAELEASRRQLAQSEKLSALGTLVSGVAHELRTPLTYLTNNLFLLQARLETAAKTDLRLAPLVADAHRYTQAMLDGVERINALVKDLRPFANTEGARRVPAGLHEVVDGAVALFRATHRGRVEVLADLQPTPPLALDRGQLQRVVINLLVNAADAMPSGGKVRVRTRPLGDEGVLEVEDEGNGIPPDVEARIFDPFFTTKADGTGLGLAITRRIVEAHGGEVEYRTRLGHGTTFVVRLPMRVGAGRSAATTPSGPQPSFLHPESSLPG